MIIHPDIYDEAVKKGRHLRLLSDQQLIDSAQLLLTEYNYQACWEILMFISHTRDQMAFSIGDGPDFDEIYGMCLSEKINDLFSQGTGINHKLSEEAKNSILIEVIERLNFEDYDTLLKQIKQRALKTFRDDTKINSDKREQVQEPDWPWPITGIREENGSSPFAEGFANTSALKILGYSVGVNGLVAAERKELLDRFFVKPLPSIIAQTFGDAYGSPGSEQRLKKMANTIASNCKNFKRNDATKYHVAIKDWETDLAWLKENYFKMNAFPWPDTFVD
jgi:hypothetical protein